MIHCEDHAKIVLCCLGVEVFGVFALELISQEGEYLFDVLREALGQAIIHVEEE